MMKNILGQFRSFFLLLAAALAMSLAGLPQAWAEDEPIRVGVTVSLTGDYAAQGSEELKGIRMWAQDLNARGALLGRPVEIVYYDDKSDAATSEASGQRGQG